MSKFMDLVRDVIGADLNTVSNIEITRSLFSRDQKMLFKNIFLNELSYSNFDIMHGVAFISHNMNKKMASNQNFPTCGSICAPGWGTFVV